MRIVVLSCGRFLFLLKHVLLAPRSLSSFCLLRIVCLHKKKFSSLDIALSFTSVFCFHLLFSGIFTLSFRVLLPPCLLLSKSSTMNVGDKLRPVGPVYHLVKIKMLLLRECLRLLDNMSLGLLVLLPVLVCHSIASDYGQSCCRHWSFQSFCWSQDVGVGYVGCLFWIAW